MNLNKGAHWSQKTRVSVSVPPHTYKFCDQTLASILRPPPYPSPTRSALRPWSNGADVEAVAGHQARVAVARVPPPGAVGHQGQARRHLPHGREARYRRRAQVLPCRWCQALHSQHPQAQANKAQVHRPPARSNSSGMRGYLIWIGSARSPQVNYHAWDGPHPARGALHGEEGGVPQAAQVRPAPRHW
jgi:hypothetical protein